MSESTIISLIVAGILWTTSLVACVWWINNRFNSLMPESDYQRKHEVLEERIRQLELQMARRR